MSPQRPRAHVLEELSRQAFRAALPAEWVIRDVEDDYGVDQEVEIFEAGQATGLTFKVQLKASDRVPKVGPSRRIDVDRIRYWNSLDVPVLVAYLVIDTGQLFGRWAHTIGREPRWDWRVRTATVKFAETDLLAGTAERLAAEVFVTRELRAGRTPRPLPLRMNVDRGFAAASQAQLVVRLRSLLKTQNWRDDIEVLPSGDDSLEPAVDIYISTDTNTVLRVALPVDVASVRVTLSGSPYGGVDGIDLLLRDVFVAVALVLAQTGATALASRLLNGSARDSSLTTVAETAGPLARVMEESGLVEEALAVTLSLLNADDPTLRDVADLYYAPVLRDLSKISEGGRRALVDHMRRRADIERSSANPRRAGRTYYNLAQTVNALGRTDEALDYLDAALVHDPGYADRDYYFRERGGLRWSVDRYAEAAQDYERALELGGDPGELAPLLADALLYAGHYAKAQDVLAQWLPSGHELGRLATLDLLAVTELLRVTGVRTQTRRPATQAELNAAKDDPAKLADLLRATDALDPRIWIRLFTEERPVLSRAVLVALVLLNSGIAWAIATASAIDEADATGGTLDTAHHIVDSAVRLTAHDEYLEAIEHIAEHADAIVGDRLRATVFERMQAVRDRPAPHTMRLIVDSVERTDV